MSELDDDSVAAALLGQLKAEPAAGARERAFAQLRAEFHAAAVHAPSSTRRRHRLTGWKIAAAMGVMIVVLGSAMTWQTMQPAAIAANLEALDGSLLSHGAHWFSGESQARQGAALSVGDSLTVSSDGGALLRISPDLTVRLAAGSRARLAAKDEIVLTAGAAFVDATPGAHNALRVVTAHGVVTHLGTQYQVRSERNQIEISVREGSARLTTGQLTKVAAAGEWLLHRDRSNSVQSGKLSADDPRFDWIAALPSEFKLDGATLGEFLTWFHRETGIAPIYAESLDGGHLRLVQLKGSIENLEPFEALSLVLATADLAWHRDGAKVIIEQRLAKTG
jgi:ferric-dicitrate binding protein FerR (iron transport regulator)